jgi:hypothetical protein
MKTGDKLTVIDNDQDTQTYIEPGSVCEFIKSYDIYACVLFDGREVLVNKSLLIPAEQD